MAEVAEVKEENKDGKGATIQVSPGGATCRQRDAGHGVGAEERLCFSYLPCCWGTICDTDKLNEESFILAHNDRNSSP